MQNQYVADVGDYGKYGLLRALTGTHPAAAPALSLGVIWYLTPSDGGTDGGHRGYLAPANRVRFQACDSDLYEALARIPAGEGSVSDVAQSGLLPPETTYVDTLVSAGGARRGWADVAFETVRGCALVFVDPDSGLDPLSVRPGSKSAPKYARVEELQQGIGPHQSLIAYHHLGRNGTAEEQALRQLERLRKAFPDHALPWAVRFRRGTARLFLIVPAPTHAAKLRDRCDALLAGPWGRHGHFSGVG